MFFVFWVPTNIGALGEDGGLVIEGDFLGVPTSRGGIFDCGAGVGALVLGIAHGSRELHARQIVAVMGLGVPHLLH